MKRLKYYGSTSSNVALLEGFYPYFWTKNNSTPEVQIEYSNKNNATRRHIVVWHTDQEAGTQHTMSLLTERIIM